MLVNLFDVEGRKVVPSQACYLIPWLKKIMEDFPEDYLQVYAYVFFTTCPDGSINPYVNVDEEDKEAIILSDLKPICFSLEHPTVLRALRGCMVLYETPTLRLWRGAKLMLDQIAEVLAKKTLSFGKEGNATDIRGFLDKLPVYNKNFRDLEKALQEEQSKVKGDRIVPYHQKEGYIETKDYS